MQFSGLPGYYTLRARLFPAIIAAAPAIALGAAWVSWDGWNLSQLIATIAVCVVLFAFADIARRQGKRVEPVIVERMGGLPSTTMLRHRDDTFAAEQKSRYLAFLAKELKEKAPSETDEAANPAAADRYYERAGARLRAATRDTKRFHILFDENITYGFRRNMYGLKWSAIAVNALIVVVVGSVLIWFVPNNLDIPLVKRLYGVLAIAAIHAVYIPLTATEQSVVQAARQYGRELILSIELLMPAAVARPRKKQPGVG